MKLKIIASAAVLFVFISCKKKPDPIDPVIVDTNGVLAITINHVAGNEPLIMDDKWYVTANGDSIKINTLAYYLSNFTLTATNGNVYIEPESYYLVKVKNNEDPHLIIKRVPPGNYNKISFLIGVDSLRNVSGAQTGALDPVNNMFWDWSTGYIMAKIEGACPQSDYNKSFAYHFGGYKPFNSVIRKVSFDLPSVNIAPNKMPTVHLNADILEWFKTPHTISIKKLPYFMSTGIESYKMADNYADMFSMMHIDQ